MILQCNCMREFNINIYGITKIKEIEGFVNKFGVLECPICYIKNNNIILSFQLIPTNTNTLVNRIMYKVKKFNESS